MVYLPGDPEDAPTNTTDLPWKTDGIFPMPDPKEFPDPADTYAFTLPFIFSPVTIKQAGYIRVRIQDGTTRIKVGALKLREGTPAEIAAAQPPQPTT